MREHGPPGAEEPPGSVPHGGEGRKAAAGVKRRAGLGQTRSAAAMRSWHLPVAAAVAAA